ncbi:MAG TPA: ABC transporter ATP-binding protein [Stellaceae bacterium]|nr:ABC transporter ATP-binding protein [Stellaceae bacterium]
MSEVILRNVTKKFGEYVAVDRLSLTVREGELVTLLGASGSGKSTCLRMVAGFLRPDAGHVFIGGTDATRLPPYRRNTGMVFQQYALFPHLTVAENVAYGLKVRGLPKQEVKERTLEALNLVHLETLSERRPAQLSGGQKQRVALARAVVIRPSVLLLDEPLSALDLKLRGELQGEIRRVQQRLGTTTLFVTHDQGEALSMSDRVAVMRDGRILQLDTPVALYQKPNCRYVANFVGMTNFLDVVIRGRASSTRSGASRYRATLLFDPAFELDVDGVEDSYAEGETCLLCVRPENVRIAGGALNPLLAVVNKVTFSGDRWYVDCVHSRDTSLVVIVPGSDRVPSTGETVPVSWAPEHAVLLRAETASRAPR